MKTAILTAFITFSAMCQPSFEAALIKPSTPIEQQKIAHIGVQIDKTHVDMGYQSLLDLIGRAYRVSSYQIAGQDWIASARFDIEAKLPDGANPDQVPQMLQALLAGRFKLAIHRESRPIQVFNLIVGKGGSKLQVADDSIPAAAPTRISSGLTEIELRTTLPGLATTLARFTGRPVFDKTGINGEYRVLIDLPLVPAGEAATAEDESGSVFTSIERLGLKLDPQREPVETIVIDHLEKTPTEN